MTTHHKEVKLRHTGYFIPPLVSYTENSDSVISVTSKVEIQNLGDESPYDRRYGIVYEFLEVPPRFRLQRWLWVLVDLLVR